MPTNKPPCARYKNVRTRMFHWVTQPSGMSCESLRESGKSPHRGASAQDGRGQVRGGQVTQLRDEVGPILPHMRDPANAGQNPPAAGALPTFAPSHIPTSATSSSIKHPKSNIQNDPVLWPSPSDVRYPLWWQSQKPDLVILGLWTRPKYDPIRRAALSATPHVIERADSDGMRTASCGLLTYAKRRFDYFRDRSYRWPSPLSIPASIFYSFASIIATPWIEFRLRKTLGLLPSILVETPHATNLWKSLATRLGVDPSKIHCVPHPIQTDIFKFDPAVPKKSQIISVGRWESYQKNLPLLLKTLRTFLDENPSWTSLVIGSGLPTKSSHPQITFLPPLSPLDLALHMQESMIFLSTSRYESFGLAAAEAGASGCAVQDGTRGPLLAAISSIRAPDRPLSANSFIATEMIFSRVPSGSYFRRLPTVVASRRPSCASPMSQPLRVTVEGAC